MKKRPTSPKENQAPCDKDILQQPELFGNELAAPVVSDEADNKPFAGTDNPRHLRVIHALLVRASIPRKQLDRVAGCSNGPELVAELRRRGLKVPCDRVPMLDRDGKACRPGMYHFPPSDRRKVRNWLSKRGQA